MEIQRKLDWKYQQKTDSLCSQEETKYNTILPFIIDTLH